MDAWRPIDKDLLTKGLAVRSYRLFMLDRMGGCVAARVIDADTDFHAIALAEMLRGEFGAELFDRSRKIAEFGRQRASDELPAG